MKAFYFFLIVLFIYQCSSKSCNEISSPSWAGDCLKAEPDKGFYKCCYGGKIGGKDEKGYCVSLTKEQCDNIDKYIIDKGDYVYCNSKYLVLSVISLILFLL